MKAGKTFEEYYVEYYDKVFKFMLSRIRNRETAEDLTMDVFTKCYKKFDEFDESKASFSTWIGIMAKCRLINYYRDHKRFDDIDDYMEFVSGFEDEIIAAQYIENLRDSLADALENLNETQRKVVILKYFHDKNSSEIAKIMGMTSVNVRVTLSRAIARLRSFLEEKNITWED